MRSLFVYDRDDLEASVPGGVQLCSREFLSLVETASTATSFLPISRTRSPAIRLRRRLRLGSYWNYDPREITQLLARAIAAHRPSVIFLNRTELIRLARIARELAPDAAVVVMSHGNQSGDDLYEVTGPGGRRTRGVRHLGAIWKIGLDLVAESWHRRRFIDGVCVMSAQEAVLERWLGTTHVAILPRLIVPAPIDWKPVPRRVGYVGTLDHTPNRVALDQICRELGRAGAALELRVVGGPEEIGRDFARRYPFVQYLGRLPEADLKTEAGSWSIFLNPVFWLARGASMKLGQGLAWGLPVITTDAGRRGYEWREGAVPVSSDSPPDFVRMMLHLLGSRDALAAARTASFAAARSGPTLTELAERLKILIPSKPHP